MSYMYPAWIKNGQKYKAPIYYSSPRQMPYADYLLLSDEEKMGCIICPDAPVNEDSDYVEVIGDGVKTFGTLLTELFALVDASKLTRSSSIVKVNPNGAKVIHTIALDYTSLSTPYLNFCSVGFTGGLDPDNDYIRLSATPQYGNAGFNARTNLTNNVATEGTKFILYYNDAHTFDFNTLAKNSIFDPTGTSLSSTNAEDAIKEVDGKVDDVYASGTVTRYLALSGYTTGSGNYVTISIPIKNKATSVTIDSIGSSNRAYMYDTTVANAFTASGSVVENIYSDYIVVSLKLASTQTPNRIVSVAVELTMTFS